MQICEQHFRVQAAIGEDHRLQITFQEFLREPRSLMNVTSPNTQIAIHDWWVVENKYFFRGWSAVRVQHFNGILNQAARQLAGIRNRRRAANKLRIRSIKTRDAT